VSVQYRIVTGTIRALIRLICRVHDEELSKVPAEGPLIIIVNHINFLEVPLLYTHLDDRPITAFVKAEFQKKPLSNWLANLWNAIPLHRGEVDRAAVRQARAALQEGQILMVAPEGTRSQDGRLQQGKGGVVFMALLTGAPILPLAHFGGETIWRNLLRLRRTDFQMRVGELFYFDAEGRPSKEEREQMTDEMMFQLARLLPPEYRGVYSDLDAATEEYLRFPERDDGKGGS